MAKDEPYLISPEEAEKMGIDEGSKMVNKLAKDQRISIELTPEQMDAILSQWRSTLSRPSSHSLSREKRRQACASPRTPTTATVVVPEGAGDRGKV